MWLYPPLKFLRFSKLLLKIIRIHGKFCVKKNFNYAEGHKKIEYGNFIGNRLLEILLILPYSIFLCPICWEIHFFMGDTIRCFL